MPVEQEPLFESRMEAAKWVARMQRPDAWKYRQDLEAWLAADPAHQTAYDKANARFRGAESLSRSTRWSQPSGLGKRTSLRLPLAACFIGVVACALIWTQLPRWRDRSTDELPAPTARADSFAQIVDNPRGSIVKRNLADGSLATVDTQTRVRFDYSPQERNIWLERGRARFKVAHDGRPFAVHAGGSVIIATGTMFDVAKGDDDTVQILLLEGSLAVRKAGDPATPPHKMIGGQALTIPGAMHAFGSAKVDRLASGWAEGFMDFDAAPLSQVVAAANRYGGATIRLQDAALSRTLISGRFRIDAPGRLAANLARSLDLTIEQNRDGTISLHR